MKKNRILILMMLTVICFSACKEEGRYATESVNTKPPGPPTGISWLPLNGGARFHYSIPNDEDLMSINAEYTNEKGKMYYFSSSFYKDSIDVNGFGDVKEYTVYLYGVNRAGVKSEKVAVKVTPLESVISRVVKTIDVKAGFDSFFLNWENELEQVVNIFVEYKYTEKGQQRDLVSVFSSNKMQERRFVNDVFADLSTPVNVKFYLTDRFENESEKIDIGSIYLLDDYALDKSIMIIPSANDSTIVLRDGSRFNTGVPAMFGEAYEGRMAYLIDGIMENLDNLNFFNTGMRGRTGYAADGNVPWNIILDLGDYYRLSRINTVQRNFLPSYTYYQYPNSGEFNLYYFDEDVMDWVFCSHQRTPVPLGLSQLQITILGQAGDVAYMFPDEPQYTKSTRWFRYECLFGFENNYTGTGAQCMSELTVYGKKAN